MANHTDIEEQKWEVDETEESEEHEKDVITYQINYYPADLTLKGYLDKWETKQLYVPAFQRNYVWDQKITEANSSAGLTFRFTGGGALAAPSRGTGGQITVVLHDNSGNS